jgi:beta-phosphoglucomutase
VVVFQGGLQAEAVIFDFDGVIVDTEPLHYKAFQKVLEPLSLGFSWQEYVKTYMGFDDRDAFKEAFTIRGKIIEGQSLHHLIDQKAQVFQAIIRDGITAYPGATELIKKLHIQHVPLAISSGALRSDIIPILEMLDISDCFDTIVTADDVAKSKPDPEGYNLAFNKIRQKWQQLSISGANSLAIEDTPAGIESAQAAGLMVVAVTNSYPRENISKANFTVNSLEELLNFRIE